MKNKSYLVANAKNGKVFLYDWTLFKETCSEYERKIRIKRDEMFSQDRDATRREITQVYNEYLKYADFLVYHKRNLDALNKLIQAAHFILRYASEIDEWYLEQLKHLKKLCLEILKKRPELEIIYRRSPLFGI